MLENRLRWLDSSKQSSLIASLGEETETDAARSVKVVGEEVKAKAKARAARKRVILADTLNSPHFCFVHI